MLVVSYLPWRDDTSVGNTLTNVFDGLQDKVEFASIYFKGGKPQNKLTDYNFYIPEKELAKSIITRRSVGSSVEKEQNTAALFRSNDGAYNMARRMRWDSMLLIQDLIGLLGVWKSEKLYQFIEGFHPDIVFGPLGRVPVANVLMQHIHEKYGVPLVAYAWDDHYSLNKKSMSLFFWIKTFLERKYIGRCAKECEFLYTITALMQEEYQRYFGKTCRVLYKSYDFDRPPALKNEVNDPVRIVYMGNIGAGRWQVLESAAKAIERINADGVKAKLDIYTMSPTSERIRSALNIAGASELMAPVPNDQVLPTMQSADILLHVEPTLEKERLFYRLSFSTKLVDYFFAARCIVATGGATAAMEYLKDNDSAVVIEGKDRLYSELKRLLDEPQMIIQYGKKAWDCGVRNHERSTVQSRMYDELYNLRKNTSAE